MKIRRGDFKQVFRDALNSYLLSVNRECGYALEIKPPQRRSAQWTVMKSTEKKEL